MAQIINIEEIPTRHDPWSYSDDGENWIFESYSPAGEHLVFEGRFDDRFNNSILLMEDTRERYLEFDPDEHAAGWYGAGMGEPSSLQDLLDDAIAIEEMYEDLSIFMCQVARGIRKL